MWASPVFLSAKATAGDGMLTLLIPDTGSEAVCMGACSERQDQKPDGRPGLEAIKGGEDA